MNKTTSFCVFFFFFLYGWICSFNDFIFIFVFVHFFRSSYMNYKKKFFWLIAENFCVTWFYYIFFFVEFFLSVDVLLNVKVLSGNLIKLCWNEASNWMQSRFLSSFDNNTVIVRVCYNLLCFLIKLVVIKVFFALNFYSKIFIQNSLKNNIYWKNLSLPHHTQ